MGYKILDYDIEPISEYGLCYKNKLPDELKNRLCTRKQWLEKGYILKEDAVEYPMHSQATYKTRVIYYLDTDVIQISEENTPKNCLTCTWRQKSGFCTIAADYVGEINGCSEWVNKYADEQSE